MVEFKALMVYFKAFICSSLFSAMQAIEEGKTEWRYLATPCYF